MEELSRYEGVGHGYHLEHLTVYLADGSISEPARTYVADPGAKNPSLNRIIGTNNMCYPARRSTACRLTV